MNINLFDIEKLINTVAKHPFAATIVFIFVIIVLLLIKQ